MLDKDGKPLLHDLDLEQYLAPEYSATDLALLSDYGLCAMRRKEFLARLRRDLESDDSSVMKSPNTDNDWHSRVAEVLCQVWAKLPKLMAELALIPLTSGEWTSGNTLRVSPIYNSQVKGYSIPRKLNLNLVDPQAEKNCNRNELFHLLGVQEAQVSEIRHTIISHHQSYHVGLWNSRNNLVFLYQTAHLDQENDRPGFYHGFDLLDAKHRNRKPGVDAIYFPDDDPYSAQQLLQPLPGIRCPDISILDRHYMSIHPSQPEQEPRDWRSWLREMFSVRDVIPLSRSEQSSSSPQLSEECRYVAKHRRRHS